MAHDRMLAQAARSQGEKIIAVGLHADGESDCLEGAFLAQHLVGIFELGGCGEAKGFRITAPGKFLRIERFDCSHHPDLTLPRRNRATC